jgi:formate-dependent nitrite reductase membrane component NrfD
MPAEAGSSLYVPRIVTKAPPWHGWVTADLFLSSLGAGTFAVAAICLLARPAEFAPVARAGFVIVFPVMLADLACLIIDLGDPARFHHMLRVFKAGSPMSVGVWTLSVFSFIAFLAFAATILRLSNSTLEVIAVLGLIPALIAGAYKGVLFSTTAQPGWNQMRWLGAAVSTSSAAIGLAVVIVIAEELNQPVAGLRYCLLAILFFFGILSGSIVSQLYSAKTPRSGERMTLLFTLAMPAAMMVGPQAVAIAATAAVFVLLNAVLFRHFLVVYPHRLPK